MVLSEAEAERRLSALRQERERLDRRIADLALYLELGRRLAGADAPGREADREGDRETGRASEEAPERKGAALPASDPPGPGAAAPSPSPFPSWPATHPPAGPGEDDREDARAAWEEADEVELSEGARARRAGRALIEAALTALAEAGRPLHAAEILAVLDRRGFALPGHDPVAALNTRLWKRAGPGGPLRRLGEAVYALAEPGS